MRPSKLVNLSSFSLLHASRESLDGDGGWLLDLVLLKASLEIYGKYNL